MFLNIVSDPDSVAVKIRGMPYRTNPDEVTDFFKDHKHVDNSVIFGKNSDGRNNGFGTLLFENEDAANAAIKALDGEYIGSRYVNLSLISFGDYKKFNAG